MKILWILLPILSAVLLSFNANVGGAKVCTINNTQCASRTGPSVCGRINSNNRVRCKLFANACTMAVSNCVHKGNNRFFAVNSTICGGLTVGRLGNCQRSTG